MSKICTSIEQSKKLIELGLNRKTSDMYYWCGSDLRIGGYKAQDEKLDIPAWSLTALLKLMPEMIPFKKGAVYPLMNIWENSIEYSNAAFEKLNSTKSYEWPIDAAFEMVIWLLENKKL